jgi:hypothetical protein
LIWQLNYSGFRPIDLKEVQVTWPSQNGTEMEGISFGTTIWAGNSDSGVLTVNSPSPLWSGAFTSQQMIFLFNAHPNLDGGPLSVTARFKHCLPLSGSLSQ